MNAFSWIWQPQCTPYFSVIPYKPASITCVDPISLLCNVVPCAPALSSPYCKLLEYREWCIFFFSKVKAHAILQTCLDCFVHVHLISKQDCPHFCSLLTYGVASGESELLWTVACLCIKGVGWTTWSKAPSNSNKLWLSSGLKVKDEEGRKFRFLNDFQFSVFH